MVIPKTTLQYVMKIFYEGDYLRRKSGSVRRTREMTAIGVSGLESYTERQKHPSQRKVAPELGERLGAPELQYVTKIRQTILKLRCGHLRSVWSVIVEQKRKQTAIWRQRTVGELN